MGISDLELFSFLGIIGLALGGAITATNNKDLFNEYWTRIRLTCLWAWGVGILVIFFLKAADILPFFVALIQCAIAFTMPMMVPIFAYTQIAKKPEPPQPEIKPPPPGPLLAPEPPPPDYSIPVETRCSHQLIVGGSGSGKTTLILEQIAEDIQSACSLVVFDSEGDILPRLLQVDYPRERVVLIDPEDECPVSISLFPKDLDRATELITYALDAINNPLTPPMRNMLRFVIRLCLLTPNPNLQTLREVFTDITKFEKHFDRLPETAQAFFTTEWKNQKDTRDRLTQRIFPLADQDAFAKMFSGTQTLNLREKLDEGSLILINTKIGSVFFTRLMVYLIYQTIQERDPYGNLMPVYLYLDESKSLMDENIVTILEKARKRRLGLVLAFQSVPNEHQDSLLANTSIKAVAYGVTPRDARLLGDSVQRDPNMLAHKRPHTFWYHVAGKYNRNRETDHTSLMKLPKRTDLHELKRENRAKYCRQLTHEPTPPSSAQESGNVSQEDSMARFHKE